MVARPRSETARRAVLEAMRASVRDGGYEAVTIEGLAAVAGVSKQTIYRWWPSKASILGEALLEGPLPGEGLVVPRTDDLATDLRTWLTDMSAHLADPEGVAIARALIAITATDPALGLALNQRLAAPIRSWVLDRLDRARTAGAVRADADAEAIADQLVAIASYAALLGQPLGAGRIDALVRMLLEGIGAG